MGCGQTDANIETGKALQKNLNLLSNTINRLDTVNNEHLVNKDIYTLNKIDMSTNTPTPNKVEKIKLANSFNVKTTDKSNIKDTLKEALENEIINRLFCDNDGNCKLCNEKFLCDENGICSSCKQTIVCDQYGNCSQCGNILYNNNGNCLSCNSECVSKDKCLTLGQETIKNLRRISTANKEPEIELLNRIDNNISDNNHTFDDNISIVNDNFLNERTKVSPQNNDEYFTSNSKYNKNIVSYDNLYSQTSEDYLCPTNNSNNSMVDENFNNSSINSNSQNTMEDSNFKDDVNKTIDNDTIINSTDNTEDNSQDNGRLQFYFYSEERFNPDILRYRPRFINNVNYETANNNIERYIEKLQKLYTMTADVVEANNTLANYKVVILDDIDEARRLNDCILTGSCIPTPNQRKALDNYILDIRNTINRLRDCNGDLTNEINKISSSNTGISHSIDVTNSNYLRILNQIDIRISYHENAIATLEQIKYILEDAKNNSSTNDDTIIDTDINDNIIDDNIIDNSNSPTMDITDETTSSSDNEIISSDNNKIVSNDDEIILNNNEETSQDDFNHIRDTQDESNDLIDNKIVDNKITNNTTTEDFILSDKTIDNNTSDSSQTVETTTSEEYTYTENNTADNLENISDLNSSSIEDVENSFKNIDTYDDSTLTNLDVFGDNASNNDTTTTEHTPNEKYDNEIDHNINNESNSQDNIINENTTTDNEVLDEDVQNIYNASNTPQFVNNNNNDLGHTNIENGLFDGSNINGFNNLHENTIISQNNINGNEIENNAYHYDSDGRLYNNTNGFDNSSINNVNDNNNNVNTYKYNTLIDSINRGTVNNGINNLSIA